MSPNVEPYPMSPIVKWAGGKTKLVPELKKRAPTHFRRYYEPFMGGGALFFATRPEPAVLGDVNAGLIEMYAAIKTSGAQVEHYLKEHDHTHNTRHMAGRRRYYESIRRRYNGKGKPFVDALERAAALVYLNRTCFNGLYRENRAGEFNVPMGDYARPSIWRCGEVWGIARALRAAELRIGDVRYTCRDVGDGDFVYLDPPYVPASSTASFTSYAAGGFTADHQADLADFAAELVGRGAKVMISNSDTRLARQLYRGWDIDRVWCPRAINCNGSRRGNVAELIITAGYVR